MEFDELSKHVIGCAIEVHRILGPGLLESVYEECLAYELTRSGLQVSRQQPLPISYKGQALDAGFRIDLLIEKSLIIELKSVQQLQPIHTAQLLTYMKLSSISVGLLLNFNVVRLKSGIKRLVL
jgi:GxxExxY protein